MLSKAMARKHNALKAHREPPQRSIDKIRAIRHLLHASIRMHLWEEDPFALHVVVQSCDKLLVDCLKADGVKSWKDFEAMLKPEYASEFWCIYREVYNYLKHADEDRDELLGVRNIVLNNEAVILLNVLKMHNLTKNYTAHMLIYTNYVNVINQKFLAHIASDYADTVRKASGGLSGMTRREYLVIVRQAAQKDEEFIREMRDDLVDVEEASHFILGEYPFSK